MKTIRIPHEVYYGEGAAEALRTLKGRCNAVFIVTDENLVKCGTLKILTDVLDEAGIKYTVFDGVVANPTRSCVEAGIAKCIADGLSPDWYIGLGGGSAMDTAKAIRIFMEYPELTFEDLVQPTGIVPPLGKYKFIGISTTSGTGSEVSFASIITNDKVTPHVKEKIISLNLVPDIAITDPAFVMSCPKGTTAYSGFDALVHAIESYTAKNANEFSAPLSMQTSKMIYENLPCAYKDGSNIVAREAVHSAQMIAGIAFVIAGLGITHCMGHQLTVFYNVPHGLGCGLMMPYVARFNSQDAATRKKYCELATAWGIAYGTEQEGVDKFIDALVATIRECNLPLSLVDMGVSEERFEKDISAMVDLASKDEGILNKTPVRPDKKQIKEIYRKAFKGIYEK